MQVADETLVMWNTSDDKKRRKCSKFTYKLGTLYTLHIIHLQYMYIS